MKLNGRSTSAAILAAAILGAMLGILPATSCAADVPGADNATAKPARTREEIIGDFRSVSMQVDGLTDEKALNDPKQLAEVAPRAIPLIKRQLNIIDELQAVHVIPATQAFSLQVHPNALLYLMKDPATVAKLDQDAASSDPQKLIASQTVLLYSRWISATKESYAKVVDDLDKLDRTHPDSAELSQLTATFGSTAPTPEIGKRLQSLLADVMTAPIARQIVAQQKRQAEVDAVKTSMLNKPYTLAGKTVQGADFSSDSMKGKVVMVDFWATWCGPCKASLPHVKEIYGKYHDKGLEIVGVSNDYAAKDLLDFTPANNMPWTQLFDPAAAAEHRWHPLSEKNGVEGIPCMFLIDKKGVLRSVTAEENMDTMIPALLAE